MCLSWVPRKKSLGIANERWPHISTTLGYRMLHAKAGSLCWNLEHGPDQYCWVVIGRFMLLWQWSGGWRQNLWSTGLQIMCAIARLWTSKTLESYGEYLIYIACTYPMLVPCLKVVHLTLDSWRLQHNSTGWKLQGAELRADLQERGYNIPATSISMPEMVKAVKQLELHMDGLAQLFASCIPPLWHMQHSSTVVALYGFGDASGSGFGTTFLIRGEPHYCYCQWTTPFAEQSSNYRELSNLVLWGSLGCWRTLRFSFSWTTGQQKQLFIKERPAANLCLT